MKVKRTLLNFCLVTMLLLVACQSEGKPIITTTSPATATSTVMSQALFEPTPTSPPPTTTKAIEAEATSAPMPTALATVASKTATSLPTLITPTVTVVTLITLTPLPTLAAEELEAAVAELLANPMDCDVPCWWGAIPNETTDSEIQQFIAQYHFTDYKSDDSDHINLRIDYNENGNPLYFPVRYSFENHLLKIVFSGQSPPLNKILAKYGEPDEVWLEADLHASDTLMRLNLIYLQDGMAVGYVANSDVEDDVVTGCFADEETGIVRLNSLDNSTSYKDFSPVFEADRLYLPLEKATDLTIEDFIQQFSDPTQPHCIETPTELWK